MNDLSFSLLVLYFTFYSMLGWICETLWCSIGARKVVKCGFLNGPWCPIYGFGALLILGVTTRLPQNPLLIFLISMGVATLLEYFTGALLEMLFQTKWWDYSGRRFNIKGRVCLGNSLLFGVMGLVVTLFVHTPVARFAGVVSPAVQRVFASLIIVLFVLDLTHTLYDITGLKEYLQKVGVLLKELEKYQKGYTWYDKTDPIGSLERLQNASAQTEGDEKAAMLLQQIDELEIGKGGVFRMLSAFPGMKPQGYAAEVEVPWAEWQLKRQARKAENQRRYKIWLAEIKEAYQGVTFTRMVWVFLIGSVIGYVAETAFCLVKTGVIESRQGMIYGPFNQVYGFGAVMMVLLLSSLQKRGNAWLFMGGALAGGVFEAVCSLVQEKLFGSVSWEYSEQPFSLFGGRSSLMYMFFWGFLTLLYMRYIYPRMVRFIDKLARRPKRFFTWVIVIFLSANLLLSAIAVGRWSQRIEGLPANSAVAMWLDKNYPDEMLEEIYPNMQFAEK